MSSPSSFNRSCARVLPPCQTNAYTYYIDPCNCTRYYECANVMTLRDCAPGTAFNPHSSTDICPRTEDVDCKAKEPWERCNGVDNSESQDILKQRCLSESSLSPTSTGGGGGGNGGVIAGAVIAVLIVIVIVVCIVLYVRKRGNPIRHLRQMSFWRGMTGTEKKKENGAIPPVRPIISPPLELQEEVYVDISDETMCRDNQLITTRPTAPPRDLVNNTHHQPNNYIVMPAGGQKTNKTQSPVKSSSELAGHSTQTQDLPGSSKQTQDLVSKSKQTHNLPGHSTQTQDLANHTKQKAVTDKSLPFYSPLEEDSLNIQPYDVLDHTWREKRLHNTGLAEEGSLGRSDVQDDQYSMARPVTLDNGDYTGQTDPEYFELE